MARLLHRRLGNYVLFSLLDRGGFADIYLAQHIYLKRYVVIKVMRTHPQSLDRRAFLREARITASLTHRHIAPILDFGIESDIPYIVMSYFPRGSLRRWYPQGERLPLNNILGYLQDIAEALEYIHRRGFVHQDIKPENMLVGPKNEIVLCDFGIAVAFKEAHSQNLNDIIGTVSYMAPERLEGRICAASDQYALGIVVYEWLMGERPFNGSLEEIVWQHIHALPPSLHAKYPEISRGVEQVIFRALEKDPRNRFSNIRDFVTALERAASTSRLPSEEPSHAMSAGDRKKRALFVVGGILVVSTACFVSYLLGIGTGIAVLVSGLSFFIAIALFRHARRREP
jgi:eukaryotic-like serine/threonine-protein kinase